MSPTPSIDTRVLKMMPRSWHISAILVSIGMRAVRREAGGVERQLAQLRELVDHHRGRCRPGRCGWSARRPRAMAFSMSFQSGELNACSICSSVMSSLRLPRCPVAAHLAAGVADERAVEDEDRRVERGVLRHVAVDKIPGGAQRRFREVLGGVDLGHAKLRYSRYQIAYTDFPSLRVKPEPQPRAGCPPGRSATIRVDRAND